MCARSVLNLLELRHVLVLRGAVTGHIWTVWANGLLALAVSVAFHTNAVVLVCDKNGYM